MARVKRLIIADAHIGQAAGDVDRQRQMLHLAADTGVSEVIYLGDAFQYLIGMSKFWTRSVVAVSETWQELRQRGVRIILVEGNRDFFLNEPEVGARIDHAARSYEFLSQRTRFRLVHGDRVNRDDHNYLFWCKFSKSSLARVWARLLPRRIAVAIVESMEARLARTNKQFRYKKPVPYLVAEADHAWKEGVNVLFWGHFHTPWSFQAGNKLAMVVPAWLEFDAAIQIDGDGNWSLVDSSLRFITDRELRQWPEERE